MTQVNYLKTVISWNGYPRYIRTNLIKQLQSNQKGQRNHDNQGKQNIPATFYRISYAGTHELKKLDKKPNHL